MYTKAIQYDKMCYKNNCRVKSGVPSDRAFILASLPIILSSWGLLHNFFRKSLGLISERVKLNTPDAGKCLVPPYADAQLEERQTRYNAG